MPYKHDYTKALDRLNTILIRLYEGQELSVPELALEFSVTERTLQRDFNERLVHMPIERVGRRWRLKRLRNGDSTLSIEDRITLDLLRGMSREVGQGFGRKAAALLNRLSENAATPIYARLNIEDISGIVDDIVLIEQAIADRKVLLGSYQRESQIEPVTIRPLKIACFEGFWYLLALEDDGVDVRKYHLLSLSKLRSSDQLFNWPEHLQSSLDNALSIWFQPLNDPFDVVLLISGYAAKYFERKPLKTQRTIRKLPSGELEIAVSITYEMEIVPLVKYWMPHVRVIEPQYIADRIREDINAYLRD